MPTVLKVVPYALVPFTSGAFAGRTPFGSLDVIATVSLVLIRFQKASTAFTVMFNGVPAVCARRVPVLPEMVPGAAASPGKIIWNCANAEGVTTTLLEVMPVKPLALNPIESVSAML